MKNIQKGDLLEKIVNQLCSGIKGAKTETDVRLIGKSGVTRQIDTLIRGKVGSFDVMIIVDAKNHKTKIDVKEVESIMGMVDDLNANLGVIICPAGFTDGAKKRAENSILHLYEIYDQELGNSNLFIPVRYIEANISKYQFRFKSVSTAGPFSIPTDSSRWIFHINDTTLKPEEVPVYIWNKNLVPQEKGEYSIKIGAIKITDTQEANLNQYCDLEVKMIITENFYLKLFPASFIKQTGTVGKEQFELKMDLYSKNEDMEKNGWKKFLTMDEMNKAADIKNQPPGVKDLLIKSIYSIGNN